MKETRAAPMNSMVFVSDNVASPSPEHVYGALISPGPFCVSVGCYPDVDGETEFILGPSSEVEREDMPRFDGVLETPTRHLIIATVLNDVLLQDEVIDLKTRVRIWSDHPRWPKQIVVAWG